jgi:hypothetical protein
LKALLRFAEAALLRFAEAALPDVGGAREAERAMKRGAFAKFDIEDALSKTKRDPSASLDLPARSAKKFLQ